MPAQAQIHLDVSFRAGMFLMSTVGEPGAQGAGITGTQGMGVSTPAAAVVAAETEGFARLLHMKKGGMFTMGMLSMIFAASIYPANT